MALALDPNKPFGVEILMPKENYRIFFHTQRQLRWVPKIEQFFTARQEVK